MATVFGCDLNRYAFSTVWQGTRKMLSRLIQSCRLNLVHSVIKYTVAPKPDFWPVII